MRTVIASLGKLRITASKLISKFLNNFRKLRITRDTLRNVLSDLDSQLMRNFRVVPELGTDYITRLRQVYPSIILQENFLNNIQNSVEELIVMYLEELEVRSDLSYKLALAYLYYYLSLVYKRQVSPTHELRELMRAMESLEELPKQPEVAELKAQVAIRIFEIYRYKGALDKCEDYLKLAIKTLRETLPAGDEYLLKKYALFCEIASEFYMRDKVALNISKDYLGEAFRVWQTICERDDSAKTRESLTKVYRKLSNIYRVIEEFERAKRIPEI